MDEAQKIERVSVNLVIDEIGERPAAPARITVRSDVIASFPPYYGTHRLFHAIMKIFAEPGRND